MISIPLLLFMSFVHWVADFVLQTREEAKNKHKDIQRLLDHTFTYGFAWFFMSIFIMNHWNLPIKFLWFGPITFVLHTITDYYTSKLNHSLHKQNRIHSFFVSIGFDQLLHVCQLFLTYWVLCK